MLVQLTIRDIVLIRQLDIPFAANLTVLTGETGAGKSILLDALSLALGARGDGGLVRDGASQGQVTAVFDLPAGHDVFRYLSDNNVSHDGDLLLKRVQTADGRSRAFVNDQPVSVTMMREIGRLLVELHGQHDERALLDPDTHRSLLDTFAGYPSLLSQVRESWRMWQEARREALALAAKVDAARREAEYLSSSVAELTALSPQAGEEAELAGQRQRMMKAESLTTDLDEAVQALAGDHSPLPVLTALAKQLARKSQQVPGMLEETVSHLDNAIDALHLAHQSVETVLRESEFDPRELERTEERLFALRAASRKYSVAVENLPDLAVQLADQLEALHSGEERLAELQQVVTEREASYFKNAEALSEARQAAGQQLVADVMQELPALKLENAAFFVEITPDRQNASEEGIDQIEFWVRTNPGTRAGPMMKIASGGELSRFLLALKVALADRGSAPTLVFDEIDTGVGGAVADAIGQRLARLANKVQVLSVTHAPQVAARAGNHLVISKGAQPGGVSNEEEGRLSTEVTPISGAERREEIARMLAGASITDEARAAAERLINQTAA